MSTGQPTRIPRVRERLGKYHLQRRIGEGGTATVFEAVDGCSGNRVALKVLHRPADRTHLAEFRKEAALLARLDHPNIVPMYTADVIDDLLVAAFPLASECLEDRMRRRLGVRTVLGFARQILSAVAHAHDHGIVHCDLKPANFLLYENGIIRLGDFGLSRAAKRTIRVSGSGTVGYMAPEQAMGKTSPRSDVFSIGLILHQMLTARLPEWPLARPLPGSSRLRQRTPQSLIDWLGRALAVEPERRFSNGGNMLRAFDLLEPATLRFDERRRRRLRRCSEARS